jgi:alpha-L-fucosidase
MKSTVFTSHWLAASFAFFLAGSVGHADPANEGMTVSNSPSSPTTAPLSTVDPAALKRWQDDRFGMFIHWGPISQTGYEISWTRGNGIPIEKYDNLYKTFDPEKFNADEWVSVAKEAGMKYIVLTCKHHDGFCLWPTKQTDYNIANTPFKRDVVGELAAACKKQGIAFGCYYSTTDWHNPDFPLTSPGGKVTREHSDLEKYTAYLKAQVTELLTNYGPLITLWFDVPQKFDKQRGQGVIDMARSIQPDILINDRTGASGDYSTPEQYIGGANNQRPWESCMTISAHNAWAWRGDSDGVKPLNTIIEMLASCAGGNGNMLLNVGPQPDGEINAAQVARLKEVGQWMQVNGDSIYGTTGGPFPYLSWGRATRKGDLLYLHVFDWPKDGVLRVPLLSDAKSAWLLSAPNAKLDVARGTDDLNIKVPMAAPDPSDSLVVLELDGDPKVAPLTTVGATASASASQPNNGPENVLTYTNNKRWMAPADAKSASLEIDLAQAQAIAGYGFDEPDVWPRIKETFTLEALVGNSWKKVAEGTTEGHGSTGSFPVVTASKFRLTVNCDKGAPTVTKMHLYRPE